VAVSELYSEFGWNVGDMFMSLIAFVVARYFLRLNQKLDQDKGSRLSLTEIEGLSRTHWQARQLVEVLNVHLLNLLKYYIYIKYGFLNDRAYLFNYIF